MYFRYGDDELEYLRKKDPALCGVIDRLGRIERKIDRDLFSSVVHQIVGQQISTKAQATIWRRINEALGQIDADAIVNLSPEQLQKFGISHRKAAYITEFAKRVKSGCFDIDGIREMTDEAAIAELIKLPGIGIWTAEMILIFCMERPNVLSFSDLAIQRGLRMLYRHRSISCELFLKYRRRFAPFCSIASFYLWAVAGGAIPELYDPASKKARPGK